MVKKLYSKLFSIQSNKLNLGMDMPQLTLPFTNATQFRAGSSVTLQCQVTTSNPPPIYYLWWYNTKELIANTTSNMLTVRNLTTNNSGAYQCEAVNSYIRRRIQHMLTIFVWGKMLKKSGDNYFVVYSLVHEAKKIFRIILLQLTRCVFCLKQNM